MGFPGGSDNNESDFNAGDPGLIPRLGRSPGEGNDHPLQYSCLENSMDRERSLAGYSPWSHKQSDKTEWLPYHHTWRRAFKICESLLYPCNLYCTWTILQLKKWRKGKKKNHNKVKTSIKKKKTKLIHGAALGILGLEFIFRFLKDIIWAWKQQRYNIWINICVYMYSSLQALCHVRVRGWGGEQGSWGRRQVSHMPLPARIHTPWAWPELVPSSMSARVGRREQESARQWKFKPGCQRAAGPEQLGLQGCR